MLISLISFTITATRRPSRLLRICFNRVVLPAPRKPERTVTGSFCDMGLPFYSLIMQVLALRCIFVKVSCICFLRYDKKTYSLWLASAQVSRLKNIIFSNYAGTAKSLLSGNLLYNGVAGVIVAF